MLCILLLQSTFTLLGPSERPIGLDYFLSFFLKSWKLKRMIWNWFQLNPLPPPTSRMSFFSRFFLRGTCLSKQSKWQFISFSICFFSVLRLSLNNAPVLVMHLLFVPFVLIWSSQSAALRVWCQLVSVFWSWPACKFRFCTVAMFGGFRPSHWDQYGSYEALLTEPWGPLETTIWSFLFAWSSCHPGTC